MQLFGASPKPLFAPPTFREEYHTSGDAVAAASSATYTVLPLGAHDDRPDYDYLDGVELHVYQLEDGESETVEIPDTKGNVAATFTVTMKDGQAQVETDSTKPYTVDVHQ